MLRRIDPVLTFLWRAVSFFSLLQSLGGEGVRTDLR